MTVYYGYAWNPPHWTTLGTDGQNEIGARSLLSSILPTLLPILSPHNIGAAYMQHRKATISWKFNL